MTDLGATTVGGLAHVLRTTHDGTTVRVPDHPGDGRAALVGVGLLYIQILLRAIDGKMNKRSHGAGRRHARGLETATGVGGGTDRGIGGGVRGLHLAPRQALLTVGGTRERRTSRRSGGVGAGVGIRTRKRRRRVKRTRRNKRAGLLATNNGANMASSTRLTCTTKSQSSAHGL